MNRLTNKTPLDECLLKKLIKSRATVRPTIPPTLVTECPVLDGDEVLFRGIGLFAKAGCNQSLESFHASVTPGNPSNSSYVLTKKRHPPDALAGRGTVSRMATAIHFVLSIELQPLAVSE